MRSVSLLSCILVNHSSCGDDGARTRDLVVANHALSQLSYIPRLHSDRRSLRVLGFEPRTSALSELRSSQLSYTRSNPRGETKKPNPLGFGSKPPWMMDRASTRLAANEKPVNHELPSTR